MNEKDLLELVAYNLQQAGLKFQREPEIGGLRPDFLVDGPRGERVVVEAKVWDPRGGNTARALEQVKHYQAATGADHALLVLPTLKKRYESKGVVDLQTLVSTLRGIFEKAKAKRPKRRKRITPHESSGRLVFAAMPFDRQYDDTFLIAMSHAAKKANAVCARVDQEEFTGDIVERIKDLIHQSVAVIVDLSEAKPNVLYEAGYAHALKKPSVHICSTPLSDLPFDVRNWNTLAYRTGQTLALRAPLTQRLRKVLSE